jgi:hypothetical protein
MTSINVLWHDITTNNLGWATRCDCPRGCDLLVLEPPPPPPQQMSTNERAHLRRVLRLAARCLPSITFVGEGCIAHAHDDDMSDALGQLCASRHLQSVEFLEVGDGEALAPLLRALERSTQLKWLSCPIEAYIAA